MKIFFDTTRLKKIKNRLLIFEIGMVLLMLFSYRMIGSEEQMLFLELLRGNVYLFEDNRNLVILLPIFYLVMIVACMLQIITLQVWIRTVEDAQQQGFLNAK